MTGGSAGPPRERSTVKFPYGDLGDAIEVSRGVKQWGAGCSTDQLAGELGQTTTSGAFRTKVATASTFGAIAVSRGTINLTDIGEALAESDNRGAQVRAFLKVPLYAQLFEKYKGLRLPSSDAGLEAEMVKLGVSPKIAARARQAFQRSAQQAGFFEKGRDRLVLPNTASFGPSAGTEDPGAAADGPVVARGVDIERELHPIIVGLIRTLPTQTERFSRAQQERWLEAARVNLALIYGDNQEPAE